jgi:hypothetical protein
MATVRLSTKEVQVDAMIYIFGTVREADAFEACVSTIDLRHCETEYRAIEKRPVPIEPDPSIVSSEPSGLGTA